MYSLVRAVLFQFDSEVIHDLMLSAGRVMRVPLLRNAIATCLRVESDLLRQEVAGITFENPVGLAAGFDKPGRAVDMFSSFGFGFLELGTITPLPQAGNEKPRIFRFPEGRALVNRMGFPSEGVEKLIPNLERCKRLSGLPVIGVNIGKNKSTPLEEAHQDYLTVFNKVKSYARYVAVNVSSPNTPELRKLQEPDRLKQLFETLAEVNQKGIPIFVKIAPDLSSSELREILDVVKENKVAGVIATNTTVDRSNFPEANSQNGGLSGAPLHEKSLEVVRSIYRVFQGSVPIIGVGGVMSGRCAENMIRAGADLVQVYTGLVYEGPSLVKQINEHLMKVVQSSGLSSISELVGTEKRVG